MPTNRPLRAFPDDNSINRRVASGLLRALGHKVKEAVDGRQALDAPAAAHDGPVLMDLLMPRVGGLGATRTLRATPGPNQRTPVIAVTASVLEEDLAACREAGCDDTRSTPLEWAALLRLLSRHLGAQLP